MSEIKAQERADGNRASGAGYIQVIREGFGEYEMIDFVENVEGMNSRPVLRCEIGLTSRADIEKTN